MKPLQIVPTEIPGLDAILGGGLSTGALTLIIGAPGAGKTVLSSQIVFAAARRGLRALVLTSFSESSLKYLSHMRAFNFFDEALVGDTITVLALPSLLSPAELDPVGTLARVIRESQAQMVLLDGIQGIGELLPPGITPRTLLAALGVQTIFQQATMLITLAGEARLGTWDEEATTADTVIGLEYRRVSHRHQRRLEVVKQRGRAHLDGGHSYSISAAGLQVYPRVEVFPTPAQPLRVVGRTPFGIPDLDRRIGGGPLRGTSTILAGATGTGKSILGLHWALAGAKAGEAALIVSLSDDRDMMADMAATFALPLGATIDTGLLRMLRFSPVEPSPDAMAADLLAVIHQSGIQRLVFDDLAVLLRSLDERGHTYLAALRELLRGMGVSALFLLETNPLIGFQLNLAHAPASVLGENIIALQHNEHEGQLRRYVGALRMRLTVFEPSAGELLIAPPDLRIVPAESDEDGTELATDEADPRR